MMGASVSSTSPLWRKIEQAAARPRIEPRRVEMPKPAVVEPQAATIEAAQFYRQANALADTYIYGPDGKRRIARHEIIKRVCWLFGITEHDLKSACRHARIVKARDYATYLMARHTLASTPEMGQALGGRDHTTILHAMNRMAVARNVTLRGRTPELARAALERHAGRWRVYHANQMRWRP